MDKGTESSTTSTAASSPATATGSSAAPVNHGGGANESGTGDTSLSQTRVSSSNAATTSTTGGLNLGCVAKSAVAASTTASLGSSSAAGSTLTRSLMLSGHNRAATNSAVSLGAALTATLQHTAPLHAAPLPPINLNISTTTGGNFGVTVDPQISVENLRKIISKKLKVAKDRICLLHRDKELQEGTLKDNNLMDGSKILLIPNVETGLLAQRPENTVMQALESLNDSQVNDFLSGKTPLNLSMRLGDHMMLIQLQLSTVNPVNGSNSGSSTSLNSSSTRTRSSSQRSSRLGSATAASANANHNHHHHHHHHHHHANGTAATATSANTTASSHNTACPRASGNSTTTIRLPIGAGSATSASMPASATTSTATLRNTDLSSLLSKRDYESLSKFVKTIAMAQPVARHVATTAVAGTSCASTSAAGMQQNTACSTATSAVTANGQTLRSTAAAVSATATPAKSSSAAFNASTETGLLEQSPIKSLSNLVSSPIKTTAIKNIPITVNGNNSSSTSSTLVGFSTSSAALMSAAACKDPIAAKLTSCLCTRLTSKNHCIESACISRQDSGAPTPSEHSSTSVQALKPQPRHSTAVSTSTSAAGSALTSTSGRRAICFTPASSDETIVKIHKTANNPISRSKHRHHHHHHYHHHHYHHHNNSSSGSGSSGSGSNNTSNAGRISPTTTSVANSSTVANSNDSGFIGDDSDSTTSSNNSTSASAALSSPAPAAATAAATTAVGTSLDDSGISGVISDTRTLAEASRNLTQTLRKLSKEVFTNKIDLSGGGSDESTRKSGSGAVIESMKNHGKGIYSGTFSGTLNPALQDRYGRPKRDISTVIHILNDLLSATPQYSRGARISFEAPSTSASASGASSGSGATASGVSSRSKQLTSSKHHHHNSCLKCIKSHQHQSSSSSSNTNHTCAVGECNGHYPSKSRPKSNYVCCQDLSTNNGSSNSATSASATHTVDSNDRTVCSCRYRIASETGEREREHTCQKCLVDMDNHKTKSKLDQLRLVMQQRKQKREARKLKGAPYGARVVGAATAVTASNNASPTATASTPMSSAAAMSASTNDVSPNLLAEEVDTAA